jgi:X-X-X-Leu-X-X-Gly heptad repeat protein
MNMNWNWNQYKAAGKHVASYAAGGVTMALAWGLISPNDASQMTEGISTIVSGIEQLAKGVGMLAGVIIPIYTAWRAAHNASPNEQAKSVAANVDQITDKTAKLAVINTVGEMPEVKKIVTTENVALNTASAKVVTQ